MSAPAAATTPAPRTEPRATGATGPRDRDGVEALLAESLGFSTVAGMLIQRSGSAETPGIDAVLGSSDRATEVFNNDALVGQAPVRGGAAEIRFADEVARELARPIASDPLAAPANAGGRPKPDAGRSPVDDRVGREAAGQRHRGAGTDGGPGTTEIPSHTTRAASGEASGAGDSRPTNTARSAFATTAEVTATETTRAPGLAGLTALAPTTGGATNAGVLRALPAIGGPTPVSGSAGTPSGAASIGAVTGPAGVGGSGARTGTLPQGAPTPGAGTAPGTEQRAVEAQVVRGLSGLLKLGGGRVNLTLNPSELGSVGVELRFAEGGVTATIRPSTAVAHDLLRTGRAQLQAALEARGTRVDGITIEAPAEPDDRATRHTRVDDRPDDRPGDRGGERAGERPGERASGRDDPGDPRERGTDRSNQDGRGAPGASEDPAGSTEPHGAERGAPSPSGSEPDRLVLGVDVVA